MSNFPENENIELQNENQEVEESTIFANPSEHKVTAKDVKKTRRLQIVLASFLAVAILVGATIAVVKLVPEKETTPQAIKELEFEVLALNSDEFKGFEVKNENGSFSFYPDIEKTEDSDPLISWYLTGYDKAHISTAKTEEIATAASIIKAFRKIDKKTPADCGLESPAATVKVTKGDGSDYSIYIGSASPDKKGVYLKLSTDEQIYLVEDSNVDKFNFTALDLATTESVPPFEITNDMGGYLSENGDLASFDSITLSGKGFDKPLVVVPNDDKRFSEFFAYLTTSPQNRFADNVGTLFTPFKTGIVSIGAYAFDVSAESLKKCGLNNPDYVLTIKVGAKSLTYKFALQIDGNYAVVYDGATLIKKVAASNVTVANTKYVDFYSNKVCLNAIMDLKAFTLKTPQKDYVFSINKIEDAGSEDDDYDILINGEKISTKKFKAMYELCINLTCDDFTIDSITTPAEYSIIFTFNDQKGGEHRIDFAKFGATRYQYSSNGIPQGKINSSALNKVIKEITNLVK